MKRFKYILRTFVALVLICVTTKVAANDSIQISLITCGPGNEVWAQYGHTAIRFKDMRNNADLAINYGMFSSSQPYFIPRFIFGLTDYCVGVISFSDFMAEYQYEGRGVKEQVLDISDADKEAIRAALAENLKPENITYRYNFFYDNCTSRARDMIINHLQGKVVYPERRHIKDSFRDLIHEWNYDYPWIQTGEDALLGVQADMHTSKEEQQFLPQNLFDDFSHATYNGKKLVKETNILLQQPAKVVESSFPFSPMDIALFLLILGTLIYYLEYKKKKIYWGWDLFLMLASGLPGIVLFLMLFSQHPCVRLNLLIFIANPLPLFMAFRAIKRIRNHQPDKWWVVWEIMLIIGLAGGLIQQYPISITIMALILLMNCIMKTTKFVRTDKKEAE